MPSARSLRGQLRVAIVLIVVTHRAFSAENPWEDAIRGLLLVQVRTDEWRRHAPYADAPPPDDAPLEVLAAWWSGAHLSGEDVSPTPETGKRLVEALRIEPKDLFRLIEFLPATQEVRAEIETILARSPAKLDGERQEIVNAWLGRVLPRSDDELFVAAARARYPGGFAIEGEEALRESLRRDRARGRMLLRELERGEDAGLAAFCLRLLYEDSVRNASPTVQEERLALQGTAEDSTAPGYARVVSIEALVESVWPGREEWFHTLFKDPTLRAIHEGGSLFRPLAHVVGKDPELWIPRLQPLIGNSNEAVHNNAVQCLVQFHLERSRWDALKPLLPWLESPGWSTADDRLRLVQSLDRFEAPESVAGLLRVLEQERHFERRAAAEALARQGDAKALPALRKVLATESDLRIRRSIGEAIIACGGVSAAESSAAIDAHVSRLESGDTDSAEDLQAQLGGLLAARQTSTFLRRLLEGILAGRVQSTTLMLTLEGRKAAVESGKDVISRLSTAEGHGLGFAAALEDDAEVQERVLAENDSRAHASLLACARLTRDSLRISRVAELLKSNDDLVRRSAEAYLIDDSRAEARAAIRANHPDKYVVLGSRGDHDPGHFSFDQLGKWGSRLADELRQKEGPDEIIALLSGGYWGDEGQRIVKIRRDRAELIHQLDEERYVRATVADSAWQDFRHFIDETRFFDLPPLTTDVADGIQFEALDLRRESGLRVFMNNPGMAGSAGSPYDLFVRRFFRLTGSGEEQVRYAIEDLVPGVRVILRGAGVVGLGAASSGMVMLAGPGESRFWRRLDGENLGEKSTDPEGWPSPAFERINQEAMLYAHFNTSLWQACVGGDVILAGPPRHTFYNPGLRRYSKDGKELGVLAKGEYAQPIVTPDGRWVFAAKGGPGGWSKPNVIVRIRMDGGGEFPVAVPAADTLEPVAWVPARGRALVERLEEDENGEPRAAGPDFYLVNPETGEGKKASGEFEPWFHQKAHSLQGTSRSNEVWAAIPKDGDTRVGRYDTNNFGFTWVASFKGLAFSSDQMWIDAERLRLLVAKNGEVLILPFGS